VEAPGEKDVGVMMWDDDYGYGRMHDGSGLGWVMALLMLVVAIAVVVAVVLLLRGTRPATTIPPRAVAGAPDARAILKERFARGDIDEDDFRARIRALDDAGG
jgi:putative membrane protein